jgi:hypothetical protein
LIFKVKNRKIFSPSQTSAQSLHSVNARFFPPFLAALRIPTGDQKKERTKRYLRPIATQNFRVYTFKEAALCGSKMA